MWSFIREIIAHLVGEAVYDRVGGRRSSKGSSGFGWGCLFLIFLVLLFLGYRWFSPLQVSETSTSSNEDYTTSQVAYFCSQILISKTGERQIRLENNNTFSIMVAVGLYDEPERVVTHGAPGPPWWSFEPDFWQWSNILHPGQVQNLTLEYVPERGLKDMRYDFYRPPRGRVQLEVDTSTGLWLNDYYDCGKVGYVLFD